jgi:hypothetical protein
MFDVSNFVDRDEHEASYQFGSSRACGDARVEQCHALPGLVWEYRCLFGLFFYVSRNAVLELGHYFGCLKRAFLLELYETIMWGL